MDTEEKQIISIVFKVILGLFTFIFILSTFVTVGAGQRGVKTRLGKVVNVLEPGLHLKLPFIEKVHKMEVKTRTINYDKNGTEGDAADTSLLYGASKDLQDVKIGVVVNYHLDPSKVIDVYSQYRSVSNYEVNVIEPIVREVVKSTSAQYTAEELVTKRAEFSEKINFTLAENFLARSAIFEQLNVSHFEFSDAFSQAIEAKVTATQNAEAAKNKLEQVKYEAQQQVETARAEAESIRIKAQAITQQGGKDFVQLQAIEKWNGVLPAQMIPGSAVPFINLN